MTCLNADIPVDSSSRTWHFESLVQPPCTVIANHFNAATVVWRRKIPIHHLVGVSYRHTCSFQRHWDRRVHQYDAGERYDAPTEFPPLSSGFGWLEHDIC